MSTTTHMIESFCTGCVTVAMIAVAIATLATITWVMLL